jgi:hypothetical protein
MDQATQLWAWWQSLLFTFEYGVTDLGSGLASTHCCYGGCCPAARRTARLSGLEWTPKYAAIAFRVSALDTYATAMAVRFSP